MRVGEFVFGNVDSLYYKLHKISLNRGGSYIDSPKWLENKKTTINPKNNDGKCFQYAITVTLNYEQIINKYLEVDNKRIIKGITRDHKGYFYCFNCILIVQKIKLKNIRM